MTCKPQYQTHKWGKSVRLTPNDFEEEVHIGLMMIPFIYSSVHHHEYKANKIICNTGSVQIDSFPWELSPEDIMRRRVEDSDFTTEVLCPGEWTVIENGMKHRICSLSSDTIITEIYVADVGLPFTEDIVKTIPAGQELPF